MKLKSSAVKNLSEAERPRFWDFWGFDNGCGIMRVISFSYGWVPETAAVN